MNNEIIRIKKIFLEIAKKKERKIAKGELIEMWEEDLLKSIRAIEPSADVQKLRQAVLRAGKKEIEIHSFPNDVFEQHYRFYFRKTKKEIEKTGNLITKNKNGEFCYRDKPIKFENKDAIYYLIFECLYEKGDLNGFCSYETINRYLEEHGKEKYTNGRQAIDRIKNGIVNLFRFSNLPAKAPDGKKIIQKVRGKGIILYNPPL